MELLNHTLDRTFLGNAVWQWLMAAGGALLFLLVALTVLVLRRGGRLPNDAILGMLSHSALAIGLIALAFTGMRVDLTALLFGGLFNVAELPFAKTEIGTDGAGFSLLVACFGLGFVGGSLSGSKGGDVQKLRRRFIFGLTLDGLGVMIVVTIGIRAKSATYTITAARDPRSLRRADRRADCRPHWQRHLRGWRGPECDQP